VVDPRALRVAAIDRAAGLAGSPVSVEARAVPVTATRAGPGEPVLVDGEPATLWLEAHDPVHATLVEAGTSGTRTPVLLLPPESRPGRSVAVQRREVVVDGWQVEVEIESERLAALRERARRGREASTLRGPTELRATIPGRVVAVSIVPGDAIVAGQQLLVVEAMKMQNELRAPRDGVVSKVAVGAGRTIEVGDLLLVLQ
jgi:biotin carboxyl carrier protein